MGSIVMKNIKVMVYTAIFGENPLGGGMTI